MSVWVFIIVLASIVLAAIAQRIAGMGFGLIITPFLVIMIGPHSGVLLVNLCGSISSGLMFTRVWRHIDWHRFWWLTPPAVLGCVAGSFFMVHSPSAPLEIGVGAFLLVALSASLLMHRASVQISGNPAKALTGLVSGITNAMAGVAGPTTSAYAVLTHWDHRSFAATVQPYFCALGVTSLATKAALSPADWPMLDWWMWPSLAVAIIIGLFCGEKLLVHVHDRLARRAVIAIAFLGALAALVKGVLELLA